MAIPHLTDDQIRTMTREQKDRWWFENVYRGDMPQLTWRSGITGFLLGGVLAAVAIYIGGKTGISIGVGLTSVVVAFAAFRILHGIGLCKDFTILENNCTQSIATSAGYMIGPLISSMAAYMLVAQKTPPHLHIFLWMVSVSILGVLVAFPLKRRFINEEQLPFPEGRACGVVLDSLYTGSASAGMFKAKLLAVSAILSGGLQFLISDGWMKLAQIKILHLHKLFPSLYAENGQPGAEPYVIFEHLDDYYYWLMAKLHIAAEKFVPTLGGVDIRNYGLRLTLDASMAGVGGLMGMKVATSVLIGGFVNYIILVPLMIKAGDIAPRIAADGSLVALTRPEMVNQWSLWWAISMMIVGSLVSLLSKPDLFTGPFKKLFAKKQNGAGEARADVLRHIELPLWISFIGVPVMSAVVIALTHQFFGVPWHLALAALPLIFVLTIIGTNSMALTSWIPTGAMSKITQFTIGAIDRTNPATNLMTGGMTSEVASNAANLLSDIKPGYMLGAKPRQQAIGHVIGIFAGGLASMVVFYLVIIDPTVSGVAFRSEFAMPGAIQWKGVSDLIAHGLKSLPSSAVISMIVAAIMAVIFEVARIRTRGKFPLSAVSIGLGVVLPPDASLCMWFGAAFFWWQSRKYKTRGTKGHEKWVEGCESICAGLISGAALMGIGNAILGVLPWMR